MKTFFLKNNFTKIIFLLLILIVPWSISNLTDSIEAQKITSDLAFYEINTCQVSLTEFLIKNINVIYQDHYFIKSSDYSSISCFGKNSSIAFCKSSLQLGEAKSKKNIVNIFLVNFFVFII